MRTSKQIPTLRPKMSRALQYLGDLQWPETSTRRGLYLVAEAACALLVGYGMLTDAHAMLWLALVAAVLEMARQNATENAVVVREPVDDEDMTAEEFHRRFESGRTAVLPSSTPPEQMPSPEQTWVLDDAEAAAGAEFLLDLQVTEGGPTHTYRLTPVDAGGPPLEQVPQHLLHDGATDWSNDEYWAVAEADVASTPIADAIERSLAQEPLDAGVVDRAPQDPSDSP